MLYPSASRPPPQYSRRLTDKILIAFNQACDQGEIEISKQLLEVLEFIAKRPISVDRRAKESLVAAHERLWQIRHPGEQRTAEAAGEQPV